MILKKITIQGFRNLEKASFSLSPSKNLIYGDNGAGKTSVLEAIFLLAFGKSFLGVKKSEILNYSNDQFLLQANLLNPTGENNLHAHFQNSLLIQMNNKKVNVMDINKYLYPVFFSSTQYPSMIESKTHLRKLMNRFIFGVDPVYMHYILCYNKIVRQKNYLLKMKRDVSELSSWNRTMSEAAVKVVKSREKFIKNLNTEIQSQFQKELAVTYCPSGDPNIPLSQESFFNQLEERRNIEMLQKRTSLGPHLDRFSITLQSRDLKFYSSGEKKIHLLLIFIAFIEMFKKIKGEYPLFLIDDFDTAIDKNNIEFLMEYHPKIQMIATSVNYHDYFDHLIPLNKVN